MTGLAEVFHAHIVDWAYPAHSHDTWAVLIVDHGAIDYSLDTKRCAAVEDTVAILPPGVVHDGQPASRARDGFWKRNLYVDTELLPADLIGPAVDMATVADPELRRAISDLHDVLQPGASRTEDRRIEGRPTEDTAIDLLDAEARLALVCERIRHRLGTEDRPPVTVGIARQLRELLDANTGAGFTLADAAAQLDRSVPHLVRSFSAAFGVSPHAYVIGRRVDEARGRLLDGVPAAQVAVEVGFCDQAHLTRHFKRHTSTTPARYANSGPRRTV